MVHHRTAARHTRFPAVPIVMAALLFGSLGGGCSNRSGVPLANVNGQVTFYGRPVAAEIIFQPISDGQALSGRPSTALSDKSGHYTLRYSPEERGAEIGKQRVTVKILPYADTGEPGTLQDATTPLKTARMDREVRPGSNALNFAIGL